jgi:hypothetical protein
LRTLWFIACLCTAFAASGAALVSAEAQAGLGRRQGLGVDGQLVGGVGLGLGHAIDNNFLGRARVGALYAYEPWFLNAGLTAELGALASFAFGAELELNTLDGWFAQAGLGRISSGGLMTHATVGYSVVGIEWQHALSQAAPTDALLVDVRLPLGLLWFQRKRDDDPRGAPSASRSQEPKPGGFAAENLPSTAPGPSPEDRFVAQKKLAEARLAAEKGDTALHLQALRQAYALDPDPLLLCQLADAELAQGKLVLAAQDLASFLRLAQSAEALSRKAEIADKLTATRARLSHLRLLNTDGFSSAVVELDGESALGALLGYDVPVDPGTHTLVVRRGQVRLLERTVTSAEGELLRVDLSATPAPASPPPSAAAEPAADAK